MTYYITGVTPQPHLDSEDLAAALGPPNDQRLSSFRRAIHAFSQSVDL